MTALIPEAVLDRHIAILGTTGAGKTSTAKVAVVEPILEAGGRVLMIDATAAWWGLRVSASGKGKGYPIYIFGGDHGDYPLRAKDAAILAETFGTSSDSAIFDLSQMTVSDRTSFFTAFAETLLRKNKGKLHVVIDEAHLYMPQAGAKVGGMVPAMLHAGNNLVSLGRSKGLRVTMITQRPAKLHKDSLTQAQALIAMRVLAPQDRAAVGDWIAEQAEQAKGKEIMASLSSLKAGEAWVWAPVQHVLERRQFPMPRTFDSSKAPDDETGDGPTLTPINLDALKGKLATVEAETKANDPRALKAEIAALKRQVASQPVEKINTPDPKAIEEAWGKGYEAGFKDGCADVEQDIAAAVKAYSDKAESLIGEFVGTWIARPRSAPVPRPVARPAPQPVPKRETVRQPLKTANGHDLTAPQIRVANSLQFWRSIGHNAPTREQVAAVAGYSPGSGNFQNLLGQMRSANLIGYPGAGVVALVAEIGEPLTAQEAAERFSSILSSPQGKIVNAIQATMTREQVAEAVGYSAGSGNFQNILGSLRTLDVIRYPMTGNVELSPWALELLS